MPRVIEVIEVEEPRGAGTEHDPARSVTVYYTLEGDYLAERDLHLEARAGFPRGIADHLRAERAERHYQAYGSCSERVTREP